MISAMSDEGGIFLHRPYALRHIFGLMWNEISRGKPE
jgi:hypothetical protein